MKYIYTQEQIKSINEGWFGSLTKWAGGLIKSGKVKKALQRYTQELPVKMKERILKEFEIQVNKKTGDDTSSLEEELKTYQEEETLIKDELDQSIAEIVKKDPEMKMKAQRLRIETRKALQPQIRQMLEELAKNDKYEHFKDNIKGRIQEISKQEDQLNKELQSLSNQSTNKLSFAIGDIYQYKNSEGKVNIVIITGKDKKSMAAKTIQRDGEKNTVGTENFQKAEPFAPIKSGFGKKLSDDDKYSEYKKLIQGNDGGKNENKPKENTEEKPQEDQQAQQDQSQPEQIEQQVK